MGQQGGLGVPVPCPGPASPETQGSVSRSLSLLACTWAATVLPPQSVLPRGSQTLTGGHRVHLVKLVKQLPAPPLTQRRCPGHCGGSRCATHQLRPVGKLPVCADAFFMLGQGEDLRTASQDKRREALGTHSWGPLVVV